MEFIIFFELFWVLAFIIAFWHFAKNKSVVDAVIFFIPAFVWAYLAEYTGVHWWQIYTYSNDFMLSLFGVPFAIAFGWATIKHVGYWLTTEVFKVTKFLKLDIESALIATFFDFLILEPLAFVFKFWVWKQNNFWFGAPLFNFIAWFMIITLFLTTYHLTLDRFSDKKKQATYFIVSLVVAFIILQLIAYLYITLIGFWY